MDKRATFILNTADECNRDTVREKALKILQKKVESTTSGPSTSEVCGVSFCSDIDNVRKSITNLNHSNKENIKNTNANLSLLSFNACISKNERTNEDISDFEIVGHSLIDRDENDYYENMIEPRDISLSGIVDTSQILMKNLPRNESLLVELGPSYPFSSRSNSLINISNDSCITIPESLTSQVRENKKAGEDYLTLSYIDEVLNSMPSTASRPSIVDKYLNLTNKKKQNIIDAEMESNRSSILDNLASLLSMDSKSDIQEDLLSIQNNCEVRHEVGAVLGCAVEYIIEASSTNSTWNLILVDTEKVLVKLVPVNDNNLRVLLLPYTSGFFQISVKEEIDTESTKRHLISVISESPKIRIMNGSKYDFGIIADGCEVTHEIEIKNFNKSMVSVLPQFISSADNHGKHFILEPNSEFPDPELNLFPDELMKRNIIFYPKNVSSINDNYVTPIQAVLELSISVPSHVLPKIVVDRMEFVAFVYKPIIMIKQELLNQPFSKGEERSVSLQLVSLINTKFKLFSKGPLLVTPNNLEIEGGKLAEIHIKHDEFNKEQTRFGNVFFQVEPKGTIFSVDVTVRDDTLANDLVQSLPVASLSISSSTSRWSGASVSNSRWSSSESDIPNNLPLNLQCTESELVWSSIPLEKKEMRSCWIRSVKTQNTEKLLLTIEDSTNSFAFKHSNGNCKQIKIRLQPNQKEEIQINFKPTIFGQISAVVIMSRINSQDGTVKTLPLFGFGGRSRLTTKYIVVGLENNSRQIILNNNSLSSYFEIQNHGDGLGFFNITQSYVQAALVKISNTKGCVKSNEKTSIEVKLEASSHVIENLLRREKKSVITLTSLNLTFGEESSRLRLLRLLKKYNKDMDSELARVIDELKIFKNEKCNFQQISKLKDPLKAVETLYVDGVHHWIVEVVVSRQALEAVHLDLTQHFAELPDTIAIEDTLINDTTIAANVPINRD